MQVEAVVTEPVVCRPVHHPVLQECADCNSGTIVRILIYIHREETVMKKIGSLFILMGFMLSSLYVYADDPEWLVDFEKAKQIATDKNLPILVNFTGSDWCSWCKKLVNEVFSKEAFKMYATEKLL